MSSPSKGQWNRPPLAEFDLNIPGDYSPRHHLKRRMRETRSRIPRKPVARPHSTSNVSTTDTSSLTLSHRYAVIGEDIQTPSESPKTNELLSHLPDPSQLEKDAQKDCKPPKPNESLLNLLTLSQLGDSSSSSVSVGVKLMPGNFNFSEPPYKSYFKTPSISSCNYTTSGNESGVSMTTQSRNKEDISPATIVVIESPTTVTPPAIDRPALKTNDVPSFNLDDSPTPESHVLKNPVTDTPKIVPMEKPNFPDRIPGDVDFRTSTTSALTTLSTPCCSEKSLRGTAWIRRGRHPFSRWRRCLAWIVNDNILTWLPQRSSRQESLYLTGIDVIDLGVMEINNESVHVLQLRTTKPTTIHNLAVTTLADHGAWCSELTRCSHSA